LLRAPDLVATAVTSLASGVRNPLGGTTQVWNGRLN
jgi:hypothetical protein